MKSYYMSCPSRPHLEKWGIFHECRSLANEIVTGDENAIVTIFVFRAGEKYGWVVGQITCDGWFNSLSARRVPIKNLPKG